MGSLEIFRSLFFLFSLTYVWFFYWPICHATLLASFQRYQIVIQLDTKQSVFYDEPIVIMYGVNDVLGMFLFLWRGQLIFWALVLLLHFWDSYVWVAFQFAGEWLMSPEFQRVHFPSQRRITEKKSKHLCCPRCLWVRCPFVWGGLYRMHGCASNYEVIVIIIENGWQCKAGREH